ncbi:flagellar hook-associated protein FlgK [Actinomycetaceae bacterium L2_0104]
MSSFPGLNTALSGLIAQRQALEITGQNMANVNTPGYTRQRANLHAIEGSSTVGLYGAGARSGGVQVGSYERLGDLFLETRVRQEAAASNHLSSLATSWSRMETGLQEPGKGGLSAQLQDFFTSWSDVGNDARDSRTARSVLLEKANALVSRMQNDYTNVRTQWDTLRQQADTRIMTVNTTAEALANLNAQIRSITASGGAPNDLIDQRAQLATSLAELVGGEARAREDGTLDVMVGGNALVRGNVTSKLALAGTTQMSAVDSDPIHLVWADSGRTVDATGGELSGILASLAPADAGGPLATLAGDYNRLALDIASSVNSLHKNALTSGDPQQVGGAFFTDFPADYSGNAVLDLRVVVGNADEVATAAPGKGPLDSSIGDAISQLTSSNDLWARTVSEIGTRTGAAVDRALASEVTWTRAVQDLQAGTGVNSDEETMNLLMYQRGYEASARLMTTIDEMLDVLINRTGVVGR